MIFSVVIPTFKDTERLRQLLVSLENQTFDHKVWETIVVNNCADEHLEIQDNLRLSLKVLVEKTPGSYSARNKGIREAQGEILVFIDSDCIPSPDWLQKAHEWFKKDLKKEIGVLTGPVPLFYKNPNSLSDAEVYEKYTGFTTEAYANEGHAITANWFSYKSVIEEFGGFNARLKSNGDSELSGKISQKYQIVFCPDLLVHHPSRYYTSELVNKFRRILGGTYARKYQGEYLAFLGHIMNFIFRRYRFSLRKFFTVSIQESWAIFKVCNAINWGALKEYFSLIGGGETKR
jgi:glycosyltransferase involved in cell wall biosynthesis